MKDEAGITLIELMVVLATVTFLISLSGGLVGNVMSVSQKFNIEATLSSLRANYARTIADDAQWENTIADGVINGNMSCLNTGATCALGVRNFTPRDRANEIAFGHDSSQANHGFTMEGGHCDTYSAGAPDPRCPIRVAFTWQPMCNGTCQNPEVLVSVNFQFSFPAGSPLSSMVAAKHSFTITRPGSFQSQVPVNCAANQYANGANTAGVRTCANAAAVAY